MTIALVLVAGSFSPLYAQATGGANASAINALEDAVRNEAIARMVHAATGMLDYAIGVIVPPAAGAEKGPT